MGNDSDTQSESRVTSILRRLPGLDPTAGWSARNIAVGSVYAFVGAPVVGILFIIVFGTLIMLGTGGDAGTDTADAEVATTAAVATTITTTTTSTTPTTSTTRSLVRTRTYGPTSAETEQYFAQQLAGADFPDDEPIINASPAAQDMSLIYSTSATTTEDMAVEVETVAAAYAKLVDAGYQPDSLVVNLIDARTGDYVGSYIIERRWADAYLAGEITTEEYIRRIAETIRT